jgi:hypothetical protein
MQLEDPVSIKISDASFTNPTSSVGSAAMAKPLITESNVLMINDGVMTTKSACLANGNELYGE